MDGQPDLGDALAAQAAGHLDPLEDPRRRRRGADRARLADVVGAVRGRAAAEVMPLDRAGEPLADRDARHLDLVADLEALDGDGLALRRAGQAAQLEQVSVRRDAVLLQVPELRLREPLLGDLVVGDLNGVVAVDGSLLDRDNRAWTCLDHCHRGHLTGLLVEDLRHPKLPADDPLHQSLISMSTPAGRSRRISESTVFGVGEWMSIRRLCVRISNASRESLSLKGLRITV